MAQSRQEVWPFWRNCITGSGLWESKPSYLPVCSLQQACLCRYVLSLLLLPPCFPAMMDSSPSGAVNRHKLSSSSLGHGISSQQQKVTKTEVGARAGLLPSCCSWDSCYKGGRAVAGKESRCSAQRQWEGCPQSRPTHISVQGVKQSLRSFLLLQSNWIKRGCAELGKRVHVVLDEGGERERAGESSCSLREPPRQCVVGQSLHGCLERARGSEMPLREVLKWMLHTGSRISLRKRHTSQAAKP